jgi:hypothetical protein
MILNGTEVKKRLHIGNDQFKRWIKSGKLTPLNRRKQGVKAYHAKFDSNTIDNLLYYKVGKPQAKIKVSAPKETEHPGNGILTRLDRIEEKLDSLIRMWK